MTEYRVGIVGTGRIASSMEDQSDVHPITITGAFEALPNTKVVAGCNRGEKGLQAFGQRWGVTALYHDYREMLERENLDIVAVATHPPLHPAIVVAAWLWRQPLNGTERETASAAGQPPGVQAL